MGSLVSTKWIIFPEVKIERSGQKIFQNKPVPESDIRIGDQELVWYIVHTQVFST